MDTLSRWVLSLYPMLVVCLIEFEEVRVLEMRIMNGSGSSMIPRLLITCSFPKYPIMKVRLQKTTTISRTSMR